MSTMTRDDVIVMTEAEPAIYESDDEPAVRRLLETLYARGARLAARTGQPVEIIASDGSLAGCVDNTHLN